MYHCSPTGYRFRLNTPITYDYTTFAFTTMKDYFLFDVIACNDVHLGLATTPGVYDKEMYEIVIGGWDNTK